MQLSNLAARFGDITDSDELLDAIRDADFSTDGGVGVDFGAIWSSNNYLLGATLTDINEPTFQYPAIDTSNFTNQRIIAGLRASELYKINRQLKLEGSAHTLDRKWTLNLGYDTNSVADPLGDDFQWLTLSGGFATDSWWLPGARLGYLRNLAGTKLSYVSAGLTAFKFVNLDFAMTLDSTTISGTKLPRGLLLSLGFEIAF